MPHTPPTADVVPTLRYRDARAAIKFLQDAFGLRPNLVVPDDGAIVQHAELGWGNGCVMIGSHTEDDPDRLEMSLGATTLYLILDDVDTHYSRAVAAGAEIVRELQDEDYGGRGYVARDPEGNQWCFGSYRPQ
ncbi:MAG: glyoxalase [Streptomycetaceae bacterium]|nr:glyoxalase [Streptomycetaceae bacterium]